MGTLGTFDSEKAFEKALIHLLTENGWSSSVLKYPSEEVLVRNWADIIFQNNRGKDQLNDVPLSDGEMMQILGQVRQLATPFNLNSFINGKDISLIRDNKADPLHYGKRVGIYLFDRKAISGGKSVYQIAEQPMWPAKDAIHHDRRGDFMLLINGMPLIHVELKKSGIPLSQAYNQIELYSHEKIFTGLFSLVQIFVAMTPDEMVYFANPGTDGKFNKDFYFHWEDFNNEVKGDWRYIGRHFLNIPMAHQLIGSYTIADNTDGILKVMRSYQYYAASAISDRVAKTDWVSGNQRGGYIWHTTGSGKTMTSFKSAELIADSNDADKVVFLVDRTELGTQSFREYQGFAGNRMDVQDTDDTAMLLSKLTDDTMTNRLIVTSIQKMSRIKLGDRNVTPYILQKLSEKRIVFIVDEAQRSTFGDMLLDIKRSFPHAIFFGFTGTPIQEENRKNMSTTAMVFGNELHRYSLADGIRDKNVLGFDPYMIMTYADRDLRRSVALDQAKAATEKDAFADPEKKKVYMKYMRLPMAGDWDEAGIYRKGIEDYIPRSQYDCPDHRHQVVRDITENWIRLSNGGMFHAILATSSIHEAIEYYKWFKMSVPELKVTAVFDPSDAAHDDDNIMKQDALVEMVDDYNHLFGQNFSMKNYGKFKKDVASRLAHKDSYKHIDREPDKQLNLVIVVDQMLTGFDSKWVNTLYLDKILEYENVIQAFSRTNRLFGPEKPFGTIHYYRKPHTMKRNIERAVKLYSGDKPFGLFADHLAENVAAMNEAFRQIKDIFKQAGIRDFEKLPDDTRERAKFASLFKIMNRYLDAAKIQGFSWDKKEYPTEDKKSTVLLAFDYTTYKALQARYNELARGSSSGGDDTPYDIDTTLIEQDTEVIDGDYMNSRFEKYLKKLNQPDVTKEELDETLNELHRSFAYLSQEEQKAAGLFLNDIARGDVKLSPNKTFRDYITEYMEQDKNRQIHLVVRLAGIDEKLLKQMLELGLTESNINDYGRLDRLMESADLDRVKAYFENVEGRKLKMFKVRMKLDAMLREFILHHVVKVNDKVQSQEAMMAYLKLADHK